MEDEIQRLAQEQEQVVASILEEGRERGLFRVSDVRRAASALMVSLEGFASSIEEHWEEGQERLEAYLDIVIRGFEANGLLPPPGVPEH